MPTTGWGCHEPVAEFVKHRVAWKLPRTAQGILNANTPQG